MPWCPNCKDEYRAGIKVCVDCGAELVDELPSEADENEAMDPMSFGEFSKEMLKAADEFELELEDEEVVEAIREATEEPIKVYVNNEELAEENRTSAYTLLVIGILGFIAVVLLFFDVLPININQTGKYMISGVMGSMFILFIIMGLVSLRNFKLFKSRAGSENQLTDEIMAWCRINFNKDDIDSKIELNGLSAEEQYFPRISYMKKEIKDHFVDLNAAYLNRLIEDVYSEVYEEE